MPNGDSTPDVGQILSDDNFKSLPLKEKHAVMLKVDPNYSALPPREQAHALTVIHYGPPPKPDTTGQGSPWIRGIYGIGRGLNDAVEGIYQTVVHPINTVSTMAAATEEHLKKAGEEPSTLGKVAEYGAAIPGVGPFGQALGERAAKGDVAGAITEGVTAAAAPFAAKEIARGGISPGARETAKGVGREVTQKYVGKTLANKVFPPPPEPSIPPEEIAYQKTKTITEAQEAAQGENTKRTTAAGKQAAAAAKSREAAFNKEGEENLAIQKRFDDAQDARIAAEKEAKNARFKADQTHAKELADLEKARQGEITAQAKVRDIQEKMDAAERAQDQEKLKSLADQQKQAVKEANDAAAQKERLKTQHGDDLMRRQKEQDALDRKAKRAGMEEDTAQADLKKAQAGGAGGASGAGGNGVRPSASERYLTGLLKRNVLTPEEDAQGARMFGDKWNLRKGEGPAGRTNRLLGDVRAMRSARGMTETSAGPTAAGQRAGIPPPPPPAPVPTPTNGSGLPAGFEDVTQGSHEFSGSPTQPTNPAEGTPPTHAQLEWESNRRLASGKKPEAFTRAEEIAKRQGGSGSMTPKQAVEEAGGVYFKRGPQGHEIKLPLSMTKNLSIPDFMKGHVSITIPEGVEITPETVRALMAKKVAEFSK